MNRITLPMGLPAMVQELQEIRCAGDGGWPGAISQRGHDQIRSRPARAHPGGAGRLGPEVRAAVGGALGVSRLFRALAQMGQQRALAQADVQRRDFDQLVVLDIGHRLLQGHGHDRRQLDGFVL